MVLLRERIRMQREAAEIHRMGDLYIVIAEQAGLDPCDDEVMERVSDVLAELPADLSLADTIDEAVDALILG